MNGLKFTFITILHGNAAGIPCLITRQIMTTFFFIISFQFLPKQVISLHWSASFWFCWMMEMGDVDRKTGDRW